MPIMSRRTLRVSVMTKSSGVHEYRRAAVKATRPRAARTGRADVCSSYCEVRYLQKLGQARGVRRGRRLASVLDDRAVFSDAKDNLSKHGWFRAPRANEAPRRSEEPRFLPRGAKGDRVVSNVDENLVNIYNIYAGRLVSICSKSKVSHPVGEA